MLASIPCQIYRGGTSKGVFFNRSFLPQQCSEWDSIFLAVMGSPDLRQIDGLGGSYSTTSKIAVIEKSQSCDYDVEYTFAQVSVDKPLVSYAGNCGNISSAVGPYAIDNGLVKVTGSETVVRIHNINTDKIIYAYIPTSDGKVNYDGDCKIAGVPGTGAEIRMEFKNPSGSMTGKLLPTGKTVDVISVDGVGDLEMSLVDSANPLVFIRASDIGLNGTELPNEINQPELLEKLEKIRGAAAVVYGFVEKSEDSWKSPGVPKLTIISPPQSYYTDEGQLIESQKLSLISRMMSMRKAHNSYAFTGGLCTASAAAIPGTLVYQMISENKEDDNIRIAIGHPGGIMEAGAAFIPDNKNGVEIELAYGLSTARRIMEGKVYYRI